MSPALKLLVHRWAPPPEYGLNHVVNRIPFVGPRMAWYDALGVVFEDRSRTLIMLRAEVWHPQRLRVGARTVIGRKCLVDARGGIEIGRDVNIGSQTRLMTAKHEIDDPGFAAVYEPIVVGDRAWLSLNTTVLGGVTIGEGAVVAAGAVVTRNVDPFTVVGGVPARPIRERSRELTYELSYRPNWF